MKMRGNHLLVALAFFLSAFNAFLSIGLVMVFSGREGTIDWIQIYLPALLLIIAACCYRFPRKGLLIYAVVLIVSILLCVRPTDRKRAGVTHWEACAYNLRFAILGGALLIINATVASLNRTGEVLYDV